MSTVDKLRQVRDVVQRGWTYKSFARDADGNSVLPRSDHAVCWCLSGALQTLGSFPDYHRVKLAISRAIPGGMSIVDFNDLPSTTKEDVLAVLDRAIRSSTSRWRRFLAWTGIGATS